MALRRSSTRGGSGRTNTRSSTSGIRKNTRSSHPPARYGQQQDSASTVGGSPVTNNSESDSDEPTPSTPEYSHSSPSNTRTLSRSTASRDTEGSHPESQISPSEPGTRTLSVPPSNVPINLSTMRELLRSHEQDIVDRVVLQLRAQPPPPSNNYSPNLTSLTLPHPWHPASPSQSHTPTNSRIREPAGRTESSKPTGACPNGVKSTRYVIPQPNSNPGARRERKWHCRLGGNPLPRSGTQHISTNHRELI
ncbi:hypothetical protein HOY80DRAFT_1072416 [Tuber brumale]|nr:hypothetical protein HOY80DRAFT_1072416 [Tuber brumale]